MTRAARKSFLAEMRGFGTRAWNGEDAMASLDGSHGHAYLAYSALALGMARLLDPAFPQRLAKQHDALIAAYERRLLASPTGLIETYPGEAYPTDVAAVAAAIAVHGRATHADHTRVLTHWAARVLAVQIDPATHLVIQRMGARDGRAHDAPRGSGTALAAYFAGFADRHVAQVLADGLFRHESTFGGFGAIREYGEGHSGWGDVDSGPVVLGVSVSATGFALAPARAHRYRDAFVRLYRTTDLFGAPVEEGGRRRFLSGGPIGDALLLALLTSGPELAPENGSEGSRMKRTLGCVVVLGGAYAVVGWIFARMTMTEGLVAPRGTPNLDVIATGVAYLGLRVFVRLVLPGAVAFAIASRVIASVGGYIIGKVRNGRSPKRERTTSAASSIPPSASVSTTIASPRAREPTSSDRKPGFAPQWKNQSGSASARPTPQEMRRSALTLTLRASIALTTASPRGASTMRRANRA